MKKTNTKLPQEVEQKEKKVSIPTRAALIAELKKEKAEMAALAKELAELKKGFAENSTTLIKSSRLLNEKDGIIKNLNEKVKKWKELSNISNSRYLETLQNYNGVNKLFTELKTQIAEHNSLPFYKRFKKIKSNE